MTDLEQALFDLGDHLDHPAGDALPAQVAAHLRAAGAGSVEVLHLEPVDHDDDRSDESERPDGPTRRTWVLAVAAALVLVLVGLSAFTPTREAIAGWLGIGAVEIRDRPRPTSAPPPAGTEPSQPVPGSVAPAPGTADGADLAAAQAQVGFPIALPDEAIAGASTAITVDPRPPGGLVAISYPTFSLLEVASAPGQAAVIGKSVQPGVFIDHVSVEGHEAIWIRGDPHEVAYIDAQGAYRTDTVRRAGNVLVWTDGDVTYRVEGAPDLATAVQVLSALR